MARVGTTRTASGVRDPSRKADNVIHETIVTITGLGSGNVLAYDDSGVQARVDALVIDSEGNSPLTPLQLHGNASENDMLSSAKQQLDRGTLHLNSNKHERKPCTVLSTLLKSLQLNQSHEASSAMRNPGLVHFS